MGIIFLSFLRSRGRYRPRVDSTSRRAVGSVRRSPRNGAAAATWAADDERPTKYLRGSVADRERGPSGSSCMRPLLRARVDRPQETTVRCSPKGTRARASSFCSTFFTPLWIGLNAKLCLLEPVISYTTCCWWRQFLIEYDRLRLPPLAASYSEVLFRFAATAVEGRASLAG